MNYYQHVALQAGVTNIISNKYRIFRRRRHLAKLVKKSKVASTNKMRNKKKIQFFFGWDKSFSRKIRKTR